MPRTLLLATMLLASANPIAAQSRRDQEQEYQSRIDTTFAFDRRGTVTLSVGGGEIVVRAWSRDQIRVLARSERSVVRMDATPTRLSLDLSRPRGGDTRFEVTVPAGVRVSARTTSGDISISGTKGGVEARTQSGDLTMSDVKGDVEATSVSGDIDLRNITARYVRAKSTSGDVNYDGAVDSTGRYELGSHSGSVYLTVPQNTGALLTVSTYSGSIDSDFPITLKPGDHGIGTSKRFTFEIGKGDARISAESFNGDITIRVKGRPATDK